MKVVCSGSSICGKTTLTKLVEPYLPNGTRTITHSRPTAAANYMGYAAARDVPAKWMGAFQLRGLFEQMMAEHNTGDNFFADRGVMDFCAYNRYQHFGDNKDYEALAKFHARRYDLIFVLKPGVCPIEDNGTSHLLGIEPVHQHLLDIIKEFGLGERVHIIEAVTPVTRMNEVLGVMRERGFPLTPPHEPVLDLFRPCDKCGHPLGHAPRIANGDCTIHASCRWNGPLEIEVKA